MVYILRTHLQKKYLEQGLSSIFGLGKSCASDICRRLGFSRTFPLKSLSEEQVFCINQIVDELKISYKGDLQMFLKKSIGNLTQIKTFRGMRHRQGLPVRGQRTHTNSRTQKRLKFLRKVK